MGIIIIISLSLRRAYLQAQQAEHFDATCSVHTPLGIPLLGTDMSGVTVHLLGGLIHVWAMLTLPCVLLPTPPSHECLGYALNAPAAQDVVCLGY